jgi:hypothetical protein
LVHGAVQGCERCFIRVGEPQVVDGVVAAVAVQEQVLFVAARDLPDRERLL